MPTCEEVFFLAAIRDRRGIDIPLFAPHFDLLAKVHNKADFAEMARASAPIRRRPGGLLLRGSVQAFAASWRTCLQACMVALWLARADQAFGSRHRETLSDRADPWVAQAYLPGEEISAYAVAQWSSGGVSELQADLSGRPWCRRRL